MGRCHEGWLPLPHHAPRSGFRSADGSGPRDHENRRAVLRELAK